MKELAVQYFLNGYSCSESVVKAAIDEGLCPESFLSAATSFSGGMSSGCLCGAVAGAQMVLGYVFGREQARAQAKIFLDRFKQNHKAACCRVLSAGFEFGSKERKNNCANYVSECAQLLDELVKVRV